jgi:dTMP kinase
MKKGAYIVIEGGEACGKDTQVNLLKEKYGDTVRFTREPGGTSLGKTLREMLLHQSHGAISLPAELFLFLADRAQHVEEVIRPTMSTGTSVISNRSWVSFMAYQIYGRNQFDWKPLVEASLAKIFEDCPIDLAIIFDMDPKIGFERKKAMGVPLDTMEQMSLEAHERIRQGYLETAKTLPNAVIIDASRSKEEVWKDVEKAVASVVTEPMV